MEPKFQSSFIPKGPLATSGTLASTGTKQKSLFGFLTSIVFAITIALSIGVLAYNFYLGHSIKKMGAEINAARAEIDQSSVGELTRLNSRIVSTQDLLNKHVVLSPLLDYLEATTLKNVRFTDFHFESTNKGLVLSMKGQARGYSAVSLQSDIFNKSKYIKNPIFSDLSLDDKGNVIFSFSAMVDPSLVSYKKAVEAEGVQAAPVSTATTTQATTTLSTTVATSTSTTTKSQATSTIKR